MVVGGCPCAALPLSLKANETLSSCVGKRKGIGGLYPYGLNFPRNLTSYFSYISRVNKLYSVAFIVMKSMCCVLYADFHFKGIKK